MQYYEPILAFAVFSQCMITLPAIPELLGHIALMCIAVISYLVYLLMY